MENWQTWAAAGVVLVTLAIFIYRMTRKKKPRKSGCSHGCCDK
jgi:hypothetical protein